MRLRRAMSVQTSVKPWILSLKSGGRTAYHKTSSCAFWRIRKRIQEPRILV